MTCSIAALIACFSWSGFYVDGGLAYQDIGERRQEWRYQTIQGNGVVETIGRQEMVDDPKNLYGWGAIGYDVEISSYVRVYLEARHGNSSIATGRDRGPNFIGFGIEIRPFRRRH